MPLQPNVKQQLKCQVVVAPPLIPRYNSKVQLFTSEDTVNQQCQTPVVVDLAV